MTNSDIFLSSRDFMYWSSVGSFLSTYFLISLDAHLLSACLHTSLMFLPENPSVYSAKKLKSSSFRCLAYLLKIAALECLSGKANLMLRSILDNIAASRSCFLFVAQISKTSVVDSKLSIFLKSVDKTLRLASCMSESLLPAMASISSMKMMTLPSCLQFYQNSASLFSLYP